MASQDLSLLLGVFNVGELPEQCQSCRFINLTMDKIDERGNPISRCNCELWRIPVENVMNIFWNSDFPCRDAMMNRVYTAILHFNRKRKEWWNKVKDIIALGDLVWMYKLEQKCIRRRRKNVIFHIMPARNGR